MFHALFILLNFICITNNHAEVLDCLGGCTTTSEVAMMLKEMKTPEKLREARLNRGYSQLELAELAGVSQASIAMIETGARKNPHPRTLRKLAGALDIAVRDLRDDPEER